jgi:Uma2 family endonuclease
MPLAKEIASRFTYQDYRNWNDGERWELIAGQAWNMTPAPSFKHQRVAGSFYRVIANGLVGHKCIAGIAPTDIVLSDVDVVQPDVFVVCDQLKVTDQNIKGAPEIVIEVLSPGTALKDRREKKELYEKFQVQEYLIVDPIGQMVERFRLQPDGFWDKGEIFGPNQTITFPLLPDLIVNLAEIFELEEPAEKKAPPESKPVSP